MGFANFHIHTYFSDGMIGPSELAEAIYNQPDLNYFSITDHDTMSAIEPFFRIKETYETEAPQRIKHFVPGVELSLSDDQTGLAVHLIGLFPNITGETREEELRKIDAVIGDFCIYRCRNRAIKDLDARIMRAFEVNLDELSDRYDSPETIIRILRKKAEEKNRSRFENGNKGKDIIQHPIPITYQTIIDHWEELVPSSTREKIMLYILRPDQARAERLSQLYMAEGMSESDAKELSEVNQGILLTFKKPVLKELGVLEGLSLLQSANAVTILSHPAVDHKKIGYQDFDHHILHPLIKHGLDGIEVFYPYDMTYRAEAINRYGKIAERRHLLISGGTDFHGDGRTGLADVKLNTKEALRIINHSKPVASRP